MFKIRVNAFLRNRFVGGNFFLQFRFVISTSAFKISIYIFKMNFYYLLGRIITEGSNVRQRSQYAPSTTGG